MVEKLPTQKILITFQVKASTIAERTTKMLSACLQGQQL